jgi:hypothetical protein
MLGFTLHPASPSHQSSRRQPNSEGGSLRHSRIGAVENAPLAHGWIVPDCRRVSEVATILMHNKEERIGVAVCVNLGNKLVISLQLLC